MLYSANTVQSVGVVPLVLISYNKNLMRFDKNFCTCYKLYKQIDMKQN